MKRKLFIGSSIEGLPIAEQLKAKVNVDCGDWISSEIWKDGSVFSMNKNALDCLVRASRKFEYGILVATKDDIIKSRKKGNFLGGYNGKAAVAGGILMKNVK